MGGYSTPAGARKSTGNMNNMKGQLGTRSSALAPTSSKLTTQYLVLDHMNNHYRKIVSAKSAIDNKAPKTMATSQKARDRKIRDHIKKTGSRPASRVSLNNMSRPHSQMYYNDEDMYDEPSWDESDPDDDEEDKLVRNIMRTTLKHNSKEKEGSTNATYGGSSSGRNNFDMSMPQSQVYDDHVRVPSSEMKRPLSTRSVHSVASSAGCRGHGGGAPLSARKGTYDGDLLQTRSHAFTEPEKPFTPRILKSTRSSKLSEYKYYNPLPKQKASSMEKTGISEADSTMNTTHTPKPRPRPRTKSPHNRTETPLTETSLMFETLQSRDFSKYDDSKEEVVPRLDISLDKDHLSWLKEQASKAKIRSKSDGLQATMSKIKEDELLNTQDSRQNDFTMTSSTMGKSQTRSYGTKSLHDSQKLSNDLRTPYFVKSPRLLKVEEELKYVEFMKEVTEDVLNRGIFTNRVLKQVFETHIRKRKGELNENRMRLMLVQVRNELDIHDDDRDNHHLDYDLEQTGTTTESSDSKFRLSNIPNRYHATEQTRTFDSTLDSQNTFGLQSTASADMFSTIHSQPSGDLGVTQALQNYQMDITKKEASEEHSPGEIDEDDERHSVVSKRSAASRRSAASKHSVASRHSVASKQRSVTGSESIHQQEGVKSRMIKVSSNHHDDENDDDIRSTHSSLTQSTTSTLRHQPTSVENSHVPSPQHLSKAMSQSGDDTALSSGADKTAQEESEDNEYEDDDYEDSGEEIITSNRLSDNDF